MENTNAMKFNTGNLTIIPRKDTLINFKKNNPILRENELACAITKSNKCKWKIGDGKTPFKKLKYVTKISDISLITCYAHITIRDRIKWIHVNVKINPFNE